MREILFRGKSIAFDVLVIGYLFKYHDKTYILWGMDGSNPVKNEIIPKTVGQYTGIKDKNGKMIFEGDILQGDDDIEDGVYHVARIGQSDENRYECFLDFNGDNTCWMPFTRYFNRMEIIGNIHDQREDI
jgi:uncharacterized phage protein (TIGR01671 family)